MIFPDLSLRGLTPGKLELSLNSASAVCCISTFSVL